MIGFGVLLYFYLNAFVLKSENLENFKRYNVTVEKIKVIFKTSVTVEKMIFKTSTFCNSTVLFQASSYIPLLWIDIGLLSLQ